jgi:hypothetical protein
MFGGKNMKFKIMLLGMFLLLGLLSLPSIVHADASDNVTIQVTIASVAALELNETTIDYSSVAPAANSTRNWDIEITNTGSAALINIYAHVFTINNETSTTRGGAGTAYAATGFLMIKNGTSASTAEGYWYAGHLTWNMSTNDNGAGYTLTAITAADNRSYGDLWTGGGGATSGTEDLYYWQMLNGTSSSKVGAFCNGTDTSFKVQATQGTKDVAGGTAATTATAGLTWSTWTYASGPLAGYCVATYFDCTKFYLYRYDLNSTFPTCASAGYMFPASLGAGAKQTFSTKMVVGTGVGTGAAKAGALQVYATG